MISNRFSIPLFITWLSLALFTVSFAYQGNNGIEKPEFNDWHTGSTDNLMCPLCNTGSEINAFRFEPEWGFSNLGFTFWNWPSLKESFIEEFKRMLGTEVVVVYQHL